jgi:hypothetical protein
MLNQAGISKMNVSVQELLDGKIYLALMQVSKVDGVIYS